MSSNFNFYVNRQGVQGKRGAKGEQGFSPVISVESQTANEYILKVENEDGSFTTPNLRGNAIENNGGTYIRFNPETEQMYTGFADGATTEQAGVVRMGTYEDLEAGESEELVPSVADVHDYVLNNIGTSGFVTTEQFNTYTSNTAITLDNLSNNKLDSSTFDNYASTTNGTLESLSINKVNVSDYTTFTDNTNASLSNLSTNKLNVSVFDSFANSTSSALSTLDTEKLDFTDLASSLIEGSNVTLTKDNVNKTITISSSGEAQVQADWAETDSADPSFIQNKPTLGTMASEDASDYTPTTGLSDVAISGSYNDLLNKPTIPAAQVNSDWNATSGVSQILNKPTLFSGDYNDLTNKPVLGTMASEAASDYTPTANLADVATTGDYDDLINKPTIPAAQVQSDWNQSDNTAVDFIKNKPTIPAAANNSTITITQGGVTKGSFTTNQSTNGTIDIDASVSITVDNALSTTSENPVQNKVVTTELNKKIEGITGSDVTNALGYTPYNATNPAGYTSNIGTVTSVNNIQPDINGNVALTIPDTSNLANKDLSNLSSAGNAKFQAPLISGTSIKTINGASILGSGDITTGNVSSSTVNNIVQITQASYDALATKDPNTQYIITDAPSLALADLSNITDTGYIKMAGASMPSGTYVNLTLGASGSTYTAPADGYIILRKQSIASWEYILLKNTTMNLTLDVMWSFDNGINMYTHMPVKRGDVFQVEYTAGGSYTFVFIYAQGSESEAS